jgi:hypothetical protein
MMRRALRGLFGASLTWGWLRIVVRLRTSHLAARFLPGQRRLARPSLIPSYADFMAVGYRMEASLAELRAANARGEGQSLVLRRMFGENLEGLHLDDAVEDEP